MELLGVEVEVVELGVVVVEVPVDPQGEVPVAPLEVSPHGCVVPVVLLAPPTPLVAVGVPGVVLVVPRVPLVSVPVPVVVPVVAPDCGVPTVPGVPRVLLAPEVVPVVLPLSPPVGEDGTVTGAAPTPLVVPACPERFGTVEPPVVVPTVPVVPTPLPVVPTPLVAGVPT